MHKVVLSFYYLLEQFEYSDLNRFITSLSKVNSPLAEMVTAFANFSEHKPYKMSNDLIVSLEHRKQCLIACVSKHLGLQQNETFQYLIGTSASKPTRERMDREITQIQLHFPHDKIDEKVHFKSGIDPRLASTSSADSRCISSCIGVISQEIVQWTALFTGIGRGAGPNGAVAG